jgi:HPt (histidine-containing phosphotransfer) domain-containing protein
MNDFISKPFQTDELHRVIRRQLHLASTTAPPTVSLTPAAPTSPGPTPKEPFRLDYLRDITGDDPEAMAELLDAFLAQTPTQLGELRQAFAQRDLPAVKRAAHTLKAPVKMLGLDEAARLFTEAQELAATEAPLTKLRPVVEQGLSLVERELPTIEATLRTLQASSAS